MKRHADFQFKKFSIAHDRSTHKVGTDGVLLGAWVNIENVKTVLDIGTGSGLVALMLAQRTSPDVNIVAVELQEEDAKQALENVSTSPWPEKIRVVHNAVQNFNPGRKFDLIVSNPPYFVNSWLPPDENRSKARHSNDLSFSELLNAVMRLIEPTGCFAVVLPFAEGKEFIRLAETTGFYLIRQMTFQSRKNKPIERLLIEFSLVKQELKLEELLLYKINEEWTEEYKALTTDFYLKA